MHRSLAHTAGATVVLLAAVLTSAAPVAAHAAASPERGEIQIISCQTTRVQSQGFESIVWTVLFGPQGLQTQETRCDESAGEGKQEETKDPLRPILAP
ncbi:hypothetical protein BV882_12410 [Streptomyces sp. 46]|nr:hypothetical protein BV882_12410 [Streptomyces sp. 46]